MASTISAGTSAGTAIAITGDTTGALALQTNNGTTAVTIDTSQNVGIGTSSPTQKLQINDAGNVTIQLTKTGVASFGITNNGSAGTVLNVEAVPMIFNTSNTERMRIDSSGNLLVGTTASSPGYGNTNTGCRLSNVQSNFSSNTADWVMTVNQNTADGSARYLIGFRVSNGQVGNIQSNGSNCTYNSTSDYRLKENVAPLTGALNRVSQLKPVTYNWKLDGSDGEGFIAHELQAVVPECVTGTKDAMQTEQYEVSPAIPATYDEEGNELAPAVEAVMGEREVPNYQGVDTSFLVATLTAAIQELNAKVDAQALEIQALKATPLPAENT